MYILGLYFMFYQVFTIILLYGWAKAQPRYNLFKHHTFFFLGIYKSVIVPSKISAASGIDSETVGCG